MKVIPHLINSLLSCVEGGKLKLKLESHEHHNANWGAETGTRKKFLASTFYSIMKLKMFNI